MLQIVLVCRKFTHMLRAAMILVVCIFGTGVDGVDLDKCFGRWQACSRLLFAIFGHASYSKAAATRSIEDDFAVQTAMFASLGAWRARQAMADCADQVRSTTPSSNCVRAHVHHGLSRHRGHCIMVTAVHAALHMHLVE